MNKEEIEEIEKLEIDFKDTDELELALEVSSKKAIYLIDDLIKHLFELQQENKELKKQLEKTNTTLDTHNELIEYMKNQQKEFVEWLENEKNIYPYDISDYTYEDIINTILSKYEEIIEK